VCGFERRESPLFVKSRDFCVWLFRHSAKFPRIYRHTLTERLECKTLDFHRYIGRASVLKEESGLAEADFALWEIRQLLRIANELGCFPPRLLEYSTAAINELGRLLGAWIRRGTGA